MSMPVDTPLLTLSSYEGFTAKVLQGISGTFFAQFLLEGEAEPVDTSDGHFTYEEAAKDALDWFLTLEEKKEGDA